MQSLITDLTKKTNLKAQAISNILKLLDEGATIPFIARYRKEMTGGASDDVLRDFHEVYLRAKRLLERKEEIIALLTQKELLSAQLKADITSADTMTALEDIYRPYKEKKNTRASVAIKNGLEPLANVLQSAKLSKAEFETKAKGFARGNVKNVAGAIKGAQDIVAERFSDAAKERNIVRDLLLKHGMLEVKAGKSFDA
ncbi:MAG: RNA-binding transcriptional accessory protein, partial [Sulfurovum sp.]|nr:RNA-binding transcriptional accessory protein [Sulfurovum sp.]